MKRRVRVDYGRGGKAFGVLWTVVAAAFVVIGVTVAIPLAGAFGVVWTVIAGAFFAFGLYGIISGKGIAGREIVIEEKVEEGYAPGGHIEERLRRLEDLYNRRVITKEEYETQRMEIIRKI